MAEGGYVLKPTPQECLACKVHSIPPPGGDLGFVFMTGLACGQNPDPRVGQFFVDSLCARHRKAWDTVQGLDTGLLHFLGFIK